MLQLSFGESVIETVVITPRKEMPFEVFAKCHELSTLIEKLDRVDENHVLWDENKTYDYCKQLAEVEYSALQNDWFVMNMELPKALIESWIK